MSISFRDVIEELAAQVGKTLSDVVDVCQPSDGDPARFYVLFADETYMTLTLAEPPKPRHN